MLIIGIDPGAAGGIAVIEPVSRIARAHKMPETERGLLTLLQSYAVEGAHAYIEKVHSSPQMGVVSAFKFGRGVGVLHMALIAARIPFDEVTPQRWQGSMGCRAPKRVEFGTKDKNITKRRAEALFPQIKVTHAIADALLIAEYGCRLNGGKASPIPAGGLFDGEEEDGQARRTEGYEDERPIGPGSGYDEEDFSSASAASGNAAGDGAAEDRAHRERRPRLRRRA